MPNTDSGSVVTTKILSGGSEIEHNTSILSIKVSKEINRISYARVELLDGGLGDSNDYTVIDSGELAIGNEIEIKAGYNSSEETIFKGIITRNSLRANNYDGFVLTIECKDSAIKMCNSRKSAIYYEKKDSDIITELIGNSGCSSSVGTTPTDHDEMIQNYISDWDFMLMRAEANGFIVVNSDNNLTVDAPDTSTKSGIEARFDGTIHSFDAVIDSQYQISEVESVAWDRSEQTLITASASAPNVEKQGKIRSKDLTGVMESSPVTLQTGGNTQMSDLQAWSEAKLLKAELSKIKGSVSILGTSKAELNTWFKLEGVSSTFDGDAYISGVHHSIEDGHWETELQIGLRAGWYVDEMPEVDSAPASGIASPMHGLQIGKVKQIHEDPSGDYRIQVAIPTLQQDNMPVWARMSNMYSTLESGFFFLPEIDDEVILGFLNEDPNYPVILGSLYNKTNVPAYTATEENEIKSILTKSKLEVQFNETDKIITIHTPEGQKVILDDTDASITLLDETNTNKIYMNADGISMESAGNITLSADGDISMTAQGNISAEASGDLSGQGMNVALTGQTSFAAEGAQAELSGSSMTTIKGGIVQIN